ncbi:amino acid ABC transporter permease [Bosea sp. (in: a-proteobacteria)]|uniref:amino acid ABC transporter permease n=1 Tax=Bosea sp. (in: a-proteobacteria) TaxID=1871050 RepID=UPI00261BE1F1|nr:amino acid ABC transporter permease [Bosea sp. (in: a-proteobacteria)]MCO5089742.1 amino acid ABC transporter permease [Bosea sp. (in: a-proteobacteria)]
MPEVILKNLPFMLQGLATSLQISAMVALGGTLLGLVVAVILYSRVPVLSAVARVYIEFIRGTPLLVVLFIAFFGLPALFGYQTTAYKATIVAFILFIGAYLAEDIRSGLMTVKPTLNQAALATGLTQGQALRFVVVPLAVRRIIPTLFNQYVRLFKFTSVASVIGVAEFTGNAMLVNAREFQPVTILAFVALTYLVICLILSGIGRWLYARLAVS